MTDRNGRTTVQRDHDEVGVRRDILLLSTLLDGIRPADTTATYKSNINQTGELGAWSYVASILSARDPDTAVAITGRLEPDRIVAAVVTSSFRDELSKIYHVPSSSVTEEGDKGTALERVERFLENIDELPADVPLTTHLRDVTAVLEWLSQAIVQAGTSATNDSDASVGSQRRRDYTFLIFAFIVKRCYNRLFSRLRTGCALWQRHPLAIIHDFYCQCAHPTHADSATARSEFQPDPPSSASAPASDPPKLRIRSFPLNNLSQFRKLLERHDIHESIPRPSLSETNSDMGTYAVSSSNAVSWAELLRTCYTTLLGSVRRPTSESGSRLKAQYPETRVECAALYEAVVALHELLRVGIVNHLITEKVRKELGKRYTEVTEARTSSLPRRLAVEEDSQLETPTAPSMEFEPLLGPALAALTS
ncbi:hypothetical protein L227DRAFT_394454 [Lentinus tigrinus ALCF2SS1-6]|uniref:Uncharacterized protein n=1 Tax=Lentinus tigrinus ALCF2SS1-6 TaxID=1328759 RepID=A0A5C2SIJ4_9APHY|nr:hypothetical protein L227DRAFT_394454 [Lentinus tigrinus ALCF2SS1-6]